MQVTDTIGNVNYTFRINNIIDDGLSLYNLVVHTDENGNAKPPYIIKYSMEENFAKEYYQGTKHLGQFTGEMSRFTIDNFLQSHEVFTKNGTPPLQCDCDTITINNGGNNNGSSGTSGSNSGSPDGEGTSGTNDGTTSGDNSNSSVGGGGTLCGVLTVVTPCGCTNSGGPHYTSGCGCSTYEATVTTEYFYCDNKSFSQKSSDCTSKDDCPEPGEGPVGINVDKIDFDLSFAPYPCQKDIVKSIKNNKSELSNFIRSAFEDTEENKGKVNLTYKMGKPKDEFGNSVDGNMDPDYNSTAKTLDAIITLDSDMAKIATDLYIATITIHENLHAVLEYARRIKNLTTEPNPSLYELSIAYAKWIKETGKTTDDEHAFMAKIVAKCAESLKKYGESKGYDLLDEYYDNLSWTGGIGLDNPTFKGLSIQKKVAIRNALYQERGLPSANGTLPENPIGNKCINP